MRTITIRSAKYDGSLHWHYPARLLDQGTWGWLTYTPAGLAIETHKGIWLNRHSFLRWHWRDRWWDVLLVFQESGEWLEWYCNIVTPPHMVNGVLRFHDLDLDVVWHHERGLLLVDTDEFEQHAVQMRYPPTLIQRAWETAQEVKQMIARGAWRFGEDPHSLRFEEEMARWRERLI